MAVRASSQRQESVGGGRNGVAMTDVMAERRLVKSRPELWAEVSEVERLADHLGELGGIRITKVEPESTVAWEGEQISGTVELEQSGWGTKVTLSATVPEPDPIAQPVEPDPTPDAIAEPVERDPTPDAIAPPVEPDPAPGPIKPPGEPEPEPGPIIPPAEDPEPVEAPAAADARPGFWARMFRRRPAEPLAADGPETDAGEPTAAEPEEEPQPVVAATAEPEEPPRPVVAATSKPDTAVAREAVAVAEPEPTVDEGDVAVAREAVAVAEPEPEPAVDEGGREVERIKAVLDGTLDALGQAHHRPFSRG